VTEEETLGVFVIEEVDEGLSVPERLIEEVGDSEGVGEEEIVSVRLLDPDTEGVSVTEEEGGLRSA